VIERTYTVVGMACGHCGAFVTEELEFALKRLDVPEDGMDLDVVPWPLHSFRSRRAQELAQERLVDWCVRMAVASPAPATTGGQ
jgi:hypothetical protein